MRSCTAFDAPLPSAVIAITAATPITMPSIVRSERILFARNESKETRTTSKNSMYEDGRDSVPRWTRDHGRLSLEALLAAVSLDSASRRACSRCQRSSCLASIA